MLCTASPRCVCPWGPCGLQQNRRADHRQGLQCGQMSKAEGGWDQRAGNPEEVQDHGQLPGSCSWRLLEASGDSSGFCRPGLWQTTLTHLEILLAPEADGALCCCLLGGSRGLVPSRHPVCGEEGGRGSDVPARLTSCHSSPSSSLHSAIPHSQDSERPWTALQNEGKMGHGLW